MAVGRPVLIVESNDTLRETLLNQLADDGEFAGTPAASIEEAIAKLAAPYARFDAILLSLELSDNDGWALCARLRLQGHGMPIIILSAADEEADVIRSFNAGASDCIVKPFTPAVLLARLRAHMRNFESSEYAVFTVGPYMFRPTAKLMEEPVKNRRIHLTEKEVSILKYLYRLGGQPASRQVLLNEVWGYSASITTHTLETHMYRLRQKIESDLAACRIVGSPNRTRLASLGHGELRSVQPRSVFFASA